MDSAQCLVMLFKEMIEKDSPKAHFMFIVEAIA